MNGKWQVWKAPGPRPDPWYVYRPDGFLHSSHPTWHSAYGVAYFLSHY